MKRDPASLRHLETLLRVKLARMSDLVFAKDMSIVQEFWSGGSFWLFGSEEHEHDETRPELEQHIATLFDKPYRVRFLFGSLSLAQHADIAWLNAPATLEIHHPDRIASMPYRLFAVFQKIEDDWHWRAFSGSEPAAPPQ